MAGVTPAAVLAAVEVVMLRPSVWGQSDCCAAAAKVFHRLHGIDLMGKLRGSYASEAEAVALIAAHGGMTAMARTLAAKRGLAQIAPAEACSGDIGLSWSRPEGRAVCICVEPWAWAAKTPQGYALIEAEMSWTWPS